MNTITELKTFKGYPHYLTLKGNEITLVSQKKVELGDGFTFGQHYNNVDKKCSPVYRVAEILEERQAKPHHAPGCIFYHLKCNVAAEDITEVELLISNQD